VRRVGIILLNVEESEVLAAFDRYLVIDGRITQSCMESINIAVTASIGVVYMQEGRG